MPSLTRSLRRFGSTWPVSWPVPCAGGPGPCRRCWHSPYQQLIECGPGKVLTALNRRIEKRAGLELLRAGGSSVLRCSPECHARRRRRSTCLKRACLKLRWRWSLAPHAASAMRSRWRSLRPGPRSSAPPPAKPGAEALPRACVASDTTAAVRFWTWAMSPPSTLCCTTLEAAGQMPTILVNNAAITRDTLLLRMKPRRLGPGALRPT